MVFSPVCWCAPVAAEVTVVYQNGLPVISVSLPSRRERCQFTLKPLSDCVGVFLQQLQAEDRGIDRVAIYSTGNGKIQSAQKKKKTTGARAPRGVECISSSPSWGFKRSCVWMPSSVVMATEPGACTSNPVMFFFPLSSLCYIRSDPPALFAISLFA